MKKENAEVFDDYQIFLWKIRSQKILKLFLESLKLLERPASIKPCIFIHDDIFCYLLKFLVAEIT